jgi:hypothetical protein
MRRGCCTETRTLPLKQDTLVVLQSSQPAIDTTSTAQGQEINQEKEDQENMEQLAKGGALLKKTALPSSPLTQALGLGKKTSDCTLI